MSKANRRILIVDDDPDACKNVRDILGELGYEPDAACSGDEALKLARSKPYDVALIDFNMPGMDGVSLSDQLRRVHPSTVAILVTAFASADTARAAQAAGAWRIVHKPIEFEKLIILIDEALRQRATPETDDAPRPAAHAEPETQQKRASSDA